MESRNADRDGAVSNVLSTPRSWWGDRGRFVVLIFCLEKKNVTGDDESKFYGTRGAVVLLFEETRLLTLGLWEKRFAYYKTIIVN